MLNNVPGLFTLYFILYTLYHYTIQEVLQHEGGTIWNQLFSFRKLFLITRIFKLHRKSCIRQDEKVKSVSTYFIASCHLIISCSEIPKPCCINAIFFTVPDAPAAFCYQDRQRYHHGDEWSHDPCSLCRCWAGVIECIRVTCVTPPEGCEAVVVQGRCCPDVSCSGMESEHSFIIGHDDYVI